MRYIWFYIFLLSGLTSFHAWGRGTGVFVSSDRLPYDPADNKSCEIGDLDRDGDLDLFFTGEHNYLYRNNGSGSFTDITADNFPAAKSEDGGDDAEFGDVDGDGDLDIVMLNLSGSPELYLNNGRGVFTDVTFTNLSSTAYRGKDIELGDVDNDGDLDIYITSFIDRSRLYLNNGSGIFNDTTTSCLPPDGGLSMGADFGDVDGDNDLDIVVAKRRDFDTGQADNHLYLNDGNGIYIDATLTNMPDKDSMSFDVKLGDVDGDNDLDIYVSNRGQNSLYLNNGNGVFVDATSSCLPDDSGISYEAALGDMDGDGDLDIFVANNEEVFGEQNRLYLNNGNGVFSDDTSNIPFDHAWSVDIELGDIDGDGDLDAVISNDGNRNYLYENNGTGLLCYATSLLPPNYYSTYNSAIADVDGDGDQDIFLATMCAWQNRLYLNSGDKFIDATSSNLPTNHDCSQIAEFGDVDNDGDPDLFIGNWVEAAGHQDSLYLNDGTGNFIDVTSSYLPALSYETYDIELGDLSGDGYIDIFAVGSKGNGPANLLYVNNGAGKFHTQTTALYSIISPDACSGDTDGDGDRDIILANSSQTYLFLNDGTAQFSEASNHIIPQVGSEKVTFDDLDNDGDLDLTIIIYGDGEARIYINEGGVFTYRVDTVGSGETSGLGKRTLPTGSRKAIYGDVNEDLFSDMITIHIGSTQLFLNGGGEWFYNSTDNLPGFDRDGQDSKLIDIDGDGDLDLFIVTSSENWIYLNQNDSIFSNPSLLFDSGDYNGDGISDIAVFRSSNGLWAIRGITSIYFGGIGDIPAAGDFNGNGTTDIAIYRPYSGLWAIRNISRCYFGSNNDIPTCRDFDGNGTTDIGIFRPSIGLWAIRGLTRTYFGSSSDIAVPLQNNPSSACNIGIFRDSMGLWAVQDETRLYFGAEGDLPVPGDYNGDRVLEMGIFRPSSGLWAIRGGTRSYFGASSDLPIPADYSGDSIDNIGIFRGGSGLWAVKDLTRCYFGRSSDIPVSR